MNWDQVQGSWKQTLGKAKQRWGLLNDDRLTAIAGRKDELVGAIQETYGIAKEDAARQVEDWQHGLSEWSDATPVLSEAEPGSTWSAGARPPQISVFRDHAVELKKRVRQSARSASDLYGAAKESLSRQGDVVVRRYREDPVSVVGTAIGVGFLVGLIFGGRRSRR